MESNITEQQYFDGGVQLPEPHFDQEATVLSARPVVPLEIKTEARSSKRLAFGLAIAVSLMLGALGATFIYQQRFQKSATAIVDTAISGVGASAQHVVEPAASEAASREEPEEESVAAAAAKDVAPIKNPNPLPRKVEAVAVHAKPKRVVADVDEEDMRRADKFEERRLRRVEGRHERREARRKNRSADDVLRIRDIFEGSRRP